MASAVSIRGCCSISQSSASYTSRSATSRRPTDKARLDAQGQDVADSGADTVGRLLETVEDLTCRVALATVYATGLRTSEVVAIRIEHIETEREMIPCGQRQGREGPLRESPAYIAIVVHLGRLGCQLRNCVRLST